MNDSHSFVDWFRHAAQYIHAHRGRTFVLQLGGDVVASENFPHLIHDLAVLNSLAIKLVIVFGARPQIDTLLKERNIVPQYNGALRVTNEEAISSVKQAIGDIKIQIEALLSMGLPNSPMADSAIKVASGNYVTGKPYGVVNGIDLGLTGRVRKIDKSAINARLDAGDIVLISPLGYSLTGEIFNLSSFEVAAQVAIDLAADKLIMLGNTTVLKNEKGEIIKQLTCEQARKMLDPASINNIDETPSTALAQGIKACESGVKRIHYIDQHIDGGVLHELFSRDGVGTLLSGKPFDIIRQATVDDIGGIIELIEPLEAEDILVKRSREKIEVSIHDYTVLVRDGTVIACAALHEYADAKLAELACLVVHPDYQKQERGELLYQVIENLARNKGIETLFILTTHAVHWFIERGFSEAKLEDLPVEKQTMYNFQRNSKILINNIK